MTTTPASQIAPLLPPLDSAALPQHRHPRLEIARCSASAAGVRRSRDETIAPLPAFSLLDRPDIYFPLPLPVAPEQERTNLPHPRRFAKCDRPSGVQFRAAVSSFMHYKPHVLHDGLSGTGGLLRCWQSVTESTCPRVVAVWEAHSDSNSLKSTGSSGMSRSGDCKAAAIVSEPTIMPIHPRQRDAAL
jgi:hypothetical protein